MKVKLLKEKIGEVFIEGKTYPVFKTAWQKESKKGGMYYESRTQTFVQEVEKKTPEVKQTKVEA